MVGLIKAARISVLVNGRPLWQADTVKPYLTVDISSQENNVAATVALRLPPFNDTILSRYEGLFAETIRH